MSVFTPGRLAIGLTALGLAGVIAWRILSPAEGDEESPPTVATITTAALVSGEAEETVTAQGQIQGAPGAVHTLSAPRPVEIRRVLVAVGQSVRAGQTVVELIDTPASALALRQAREGLDFAEREAARVRRLFDAHLTAADQMNAANRALADARSILAALTTSGANGSVQTLRAPVAGVVSNLPVAVGDHVAADAPLAAVTAGGQQTAQLWVEPGRAKTLSLGQTVRVVDIFDAQNTSTGKLGLIGGQIDPATHLVGASVLLQSGSALRMGEPVMAHIVTERHAGLLAPRAAVAFDEDGAHLFVIQGGKAHSVAVRLGAEIGDQVGVRGEVKAGAQVAVEGAYELKDAMPVRIRGT